ncbi:Uncharacterized protein HZ326_5805 [Fusarium oxysporum f. sp. albedinis]|nr:Uncharacterized protein HZ326_5805 [Fusarium oxysporum f. sp. albedinis]
MSRLTTSKIPCHDWTLITKTRATEIACSAAQAPPRPSCYRVSKAPKPLPAFGSATKIGTLELTIPVFIETFLFETTPTTFIFIPWW